MSGYYPPSSSQIDTLTNQYAQDQKYASYSGSSLPHGNMMMYLNPASSAGSFSELSAGNSMSPHNGVEIPSMAARNEMMFIPPTGDSMCIQAINRQLNPTTAHAVSSSVPEELQLTSRNQLSIVDGEQNLQGLSLSLSTQMSTAVSTSPFQYQYPNPGLSSVLNPHLHLSAENDCRGMAGKIDPSQNKDLRNVDYLQYDLHGHGNNVVRFGAPDNMQYSINQKSIACNPYQYEQAGMASTILKSKYLKAAQQLLDEVVNVRDALKRSESGKDHSLNKVEDGSKESKGESMPASETNESGTATSRELSATERQDLQNKLDKLLSMLDEVDRRYKQYSHQMQILISSFDMVAGCGAARPYTTLALKTISRHFRCLRDAISNQIQVTRKSLGEQDTSGGVIPRLRYVDQQLRQQRALQQFGMMRHAWRPQRGLPESAVSILRAWLFEHFLHPYPKDSEKIMLARQTGLTRSQVANWFINARVRLWKPMVEEMYKEEFGEMDINSKSSPENAPKGGGREKSWASEDRRDELQESATSMGLAGDGANSGQFHDMKHDSNHDGEIKGPMPGDLDTHGLYANATIPAIQNGVGNFMVTSTAYQMPELGNFGVDNHVSLALGLRHQQGDVVSFSAGTSYRGSATAEANLGGGTSEFPYMDQVSQQHRFGNPHILNDFVA